MVKIRACFALAAFVASCNVPTTTLALIIDDFTEGAVTLSVPLGGGTVVDLKTGLDPAHNAATARHITFRAFDGYPYGDMGQVTIEVEPDDGGVLRHVPDVGLSATDLYIRYGSTEIGMPPMSLDLLAGGATKLAFDFDYAILNPGAELTDFLMNLNLFTGSGPGLLTGLAFSPSPTPFTVELSFADVLSDAPVLDLTDVSEIMFGASDERMNGQYAITAIYTIPEPAAAVTLFLGIIILFARSVRTQLKFLSVARIKCE